MNIRSPRRPLWPSFLLGLVVLLLALAQGGPWPALAALGRGAGIVKPAASTPDAYLPSPTPAAQLAGRSGSVALATATPQRTTERTSLIPLPDDVTFSRLTTWRYPDDPRIEAMRPLIVVTLRERELFFNGASGRVSTFYPGLGYDKLYGRDLALMLPAAQYLYPDEYLRTGIEELLIRQYGDDTRSDGGDGGAFIGDGALPGSIDAGGAIDKQTVTSDEETSVIHAAYQYYTIAGGSAWLKKDLGGQTVLQRLNSAIEWLYSRRFDASRRLFKRGHTTDWGDVKFEPALNPTDIDLTYDHWTASIYDQAMAYRALCDLAEMHRGSGQDERSAVLLARAEDLRQAANRFLWMPERGYYRLHTHITPLTHASFNEDEQVAIGNAAAIAAGMTTSEQERSIIARLEEARLAAGARKPGLTLYPSYPAGFFATVQRNRGEYQNGGLWDSWAGVQIAAEFQSGFSDIALGHLYQVAADWAQHANVIWEWTLPKSSAGQGAKSFATAAGAVGNAIIDGLYGVSLTRDGAHIEPRLGVHNGSVRVYQSASDRYVAYSYTYKTEAITLRYGTNATGDVTLRVLIPAGRLPQTVRIGNSDVTPRRETVNDDLYAVFKGPVGSNVVTITLTAVPSGVGGVTLDPAFFDYYQNKSGARLLGAPLTPALADGTRRVQYFEKGRLELDNRQSADVQFAYGALGEEMVRSGANLPVGGDNSSITYAKLKELADRPRLSAPRDFKSGVYRNRDGTVFIPFSADLKPAPGHNVAAIFWIVLSSDERSPGGWQHDVGLPLTEAVWATIDKDGQKGKRVLIQAFQRAILVYDAQKTPGWQVERANIGVDYLKLYPERGK